MDELEKLNKKLADLDLIRQATELNNVGLNEIAALDDKYTELIDEVDAYLIKASKDVDSIGIEALTSILNAGADFKKKIDNSRLDVIMARVSIEAKIEETKDNLARVRADKTSLQNRIKKFEKALGDIKASTPSDAYLPHIEALEAELENDKNRLDELNKRQIELRDKLKALVPGSEKKKKTKKSNKTQEEEKSEGGRHLAKDVTEEKPIEEKSIEEKPVEEKPIEEKSIEEKPVDKPEGIDFEDEEQLDGFETRDNEEKDKDGALIPTGKEGRKEVPETLGEKESERKEVPEELGTTGRKEVPELIDSETYEAEVEQPKKGLWKKIVAIVAPVAAFLGGLFAVKAINANKEPETATYEVEETPIDETATIVEEPEEEKPAEEETHGITVTPTIYTTPTIPADDPIVDEPEQEIEIKLNEGDVTLKAGEEALETTTGIGVTADGTQRHYNEDHSFDVVGHLDLEHTSDGTSVVRDSAFNAPSNQETHNMTEAEARATMTETQAAQMDQASSEIDWKSLFEEQNTLSR